MAHQLKRLFRAKTVSILTYEGWGSDGPLRIVEDVHAGYVDPELNRQWRASARYSDARKDPLTAKMVAHRRRAVATAPLEALMTREEWSEYPSSEGMKAQGFGDILLGVFGTSRNGTACGVAIFASEGQKPWTPRQRQLFHIILLELRRHLKAPRRPVELDVDGNPDGPPELTAREQDVLARLLKGESVKEAAAALGIAHSTVAGYVKTIYRNYKVQSRAELMSKFIGKS